MVKVLKLVVKLLIKYIHFLAGLIYLNLNITNGIFLEN